MTKVIPLPPQGQGQTQEEAEEKEPYLRRRRRGRVSRRGAGLFTIGFAEEEPASALVAACAKCAREP